MRVLRLFLWILVFIPLIITFFMLPILSDAIPIHFGWGGDVTTYGSKYVMFVLPGATMFIALFWLAMEKIAIKQDEEKGVRNGKVLLWLNVISVSYLTIMTIQFAFVAYNDIQNINEGIFDITKILTVGLGVCYVVLGNLLPKCKQNALIGFRTKWTLKSELSWYKTHRLGGKIILIYGILSIILSLFVLDGIVGLFASVGGLLIITIPLIIYSYHVYKHDTH